MANRTAGQMSGITLFITPADSYNLPEANLQP